MKFLVSLIFVIASFNTMAETRYISDEVHVPLRSSPCPRCSIVHQGIKSGAVLTVIQDQDGWTNVRTRSGLEGWLPSQYLVNQQIAKIRITGIEKNLSDQQQQNRELDATLSQLRESNRALEAQLNELSSSKSSIDNELKRIKQVSANALNLESQNKELLKRNNILQNQIDVLAAANQQLENKDSQLWFLYGAIAVVIGAMLAVILPRLKRRKGFSEWA